jgi:hypothetical protein
LPFLLSLETLNTETKWMRSRDYITSVLIRIGPTTLRAS